LFVFFYIGRIVDHHCFNFLFIINVLSDFSGIKYTLVLYVNDLVKMNIFIVLTIS
jgi:hypothetical protein